MLNDSASRLAWACATEAYLHSLLQAVTMLEATCNKQVLFVSVVLCMSLVAAPARSGCRSCRSGWSTAAS